MYNNLKRNSSYSSVKLLLADDFELVRIGLRSIFNKYKDFVLIQDAINGDDAVELALYHKPDVVLMDVKMPHYTGIEAAGIINLKYPEIKIILISAFEDEGIKINNLPENVKGFLLKNINSDNLVDAVRQVNDGYYVYSTEIIANYLELNDELYDHNTNYIVLNENPFNSIIS